MGNMTDKFNALGTLLHPHSHRFSQVRTNVVPVLAHVHRSLIFADSGKRMHVVEVSLAKLDSIALGKIKFPVKCRIESLSNVAVPVFPSLHSSNNQSTSSAR